MAQIRQFDANGRPCDKTVLELFSEWYQSIRHNIKESTASNYLLKAQKHILPDFREYRIDNLKASDVYDFIHKKQASGLSNRYISDIIILMKTMFKYAAKTYHIFNPMDEITPPKKKSSICIELTYLRHFLINLFSCFPEEILKFPITVSTFSPWNPPFPTTVLSMINISSYHFCLLMCILHKLRIEILCVFLTKNVEKGIDN
jgi:hypothetical protein